MHDACGIGEMAVKLYDSMTNVYYIVQFALWVLLVVDVIIVFLYRRNVKHI